MKLLRTSFFVAAVLSLSILALYMLPDKVCRDGRNEKCCKQEQACKGKDKHCEGKDKRCQEKQSCCKSQEQRCEREWKDADGKMHKEIRIEIRDDGDRKGGCGGHGEMRGGCSGDKKDACEMGEGMEMPMGCGGMQMHGCCCCAMMMMMHGGMMDHCKMDKDSMVLDTTVRVKVRGKL
jgi:hypothetical protein